MQVTNKRKNKSNTKNEKPFFILEISTKKKIEKALLFLIALAAVYELVTISSMRNSTNTSLEIVKSNTEVKAKHGEILRVFGVRCCDYELLERNNIEYVKNQDELVGTQVKNEIQFNNKYKVVKKDKKAKDKNKKSVEKEVKYILVDNIYFRNSVVNLVLNRVNNTIYDVYSRYLNNKQTKVLEKDNEELKNLGVITQSITRIETDTENVLKELSKNEKKYLDEVINEIKSSVEYGSNNLEIKNKYLGNEVIDKLKRYKAKQLNNIVYYNIGKSDISINYYDRILIQTFDGHGYTNIVLKVDKDKRVFDIINI